MSMGSHVIEVRQGLYEDVQQKDATRVFPWTDISYAGAEVAASSSVLASCMVPIVAGVTLGDGNQGLYQPEILNLDKTIKYGKKNVADDGKAKVNPTNWMQTGFGMCDYLFGVSPDRSYLSVRGKADNETFNKKRLELYSKPRGRANIEGTAPLEIKQYMSEDEALDEITAHPARMIIGFVIGPRDVKLYYTETAIAMMVRRMRRIIEALGPQKPTYYPLGLGHLEKNGKPWTPKGVGKSGGGVPSIRAPSGIWNAGAVQYKANALKATGSLYIPWDQTPYSVMRRNFKYNHVMTQIGMELLETLTAVGIDMNENLKGNPVTAFIENGEGAQVAGLQMLFASMFGTTATHSATSDFQVDEISVASGLKDRLGFLFNSGHIHIDPGVFSFERKGGGGFLNAEGAGVGMLDPSTDDDLSYKGVNGVSAELLYKEFIAKYITFNVAAACLENYFAVPLYQCHWLYVGSPKPEYVTEQLQMNFRSDVYFDGDNSLPFTLIPSLLNPGQVLSRIPCYLDISAQGLTASGQAAKGAWINTYLGVRDPLPYGSVTDIRYAGDRPLTTIEEREYTFAPIIEADASVQTQYRNSRTVNCANWPRPTVYSPGATRMGAIYGLMSDNASVGGHYYYQPLTGTMLNDNVANVLFRTMTNDKRESKKLADQLFKGQSREEIETQGKYWDKHSIEQGNNPQSTDAYTEAELKALANANPVEPAVFPTTVSGKRDN
jgi:hypothetical protein